MEPSSIALEVDPNVVSPPLRIQTYAIENWLVHPDWRDYSVNVSELIGTTELSVFLLHPVDLIISKLERNDPDDIEDARYLRARYIDDVQTVVERLDEAWQFYPGSERSKGEIEHAFEAIFELRHELED
jgi:hypothetical protein